MTEATTNQENQSQVAEEPQRDSSGKVLVNHLVKFRKRTKTEKGADGKDVSITVQRDAIPVTVFLHTKDSLLEVLVNGDDGTKDFLVALVNDQITSAIKAVFDENEDAKNQGDVDLSLCTLENIAKDSGSAGFKPTKEEFEAFAKHYVHVMPSLGVKSEAAKMGAAEFMGGKFQRTAYNENALKSLKSRLTQYVDNVPDAGDHEKATAYLQRRIDKLLDAINGNLEY